MGQKTRAQPFVSLSLFLISTHQHTDLARRILSFSMTSQDNISFHVRAGSTVLSKFLLAAFLISGDLPLIFFALFFLRDCEIVAVLRFFDFSLTRSRSLSRSRSHSVASLG